jgi:ribosomal protein L32
MGTVTGTGATVTFSAKNTAGTVGLFVNVTLNGTVKGGVAIITVTVPAPTLTSVAVNPATASLTSGGKQVFTATPTCSATCPSGITYTWSLGNNDGNITAATGASTTFTAGNTSGVVSLKVTATLNGVSKSDAAEITLKSQVINSSSTAFPWWILLVVLAAVVVAMVIVLERRRRARNKMKEAEHPESGASEVAAGAPAGAESAAPVQETAGAGAMVDIGLMGTTLPDMGAETPVQAPAEGEVPALAQCPQCGNPMGPDRICYTCGVGWAREEPEAESVAEPQAEVPPPPPEFVPGTPLPPLTHCPQCGNPIGPDMICLTCGVTWSPDQGAPPPEGAAEPMSEPMSEPTLETPPPPPPEEEPVAEPSPEEPPEAEPAKESAVTTEEIQSETVSEPGAVVKEVTPEPEQAEERPHEAAPADLPSGTPEAETEVAPPPKVAGGVVGGKEARDKSRVCFICGLELEGDFCPVCNMHWDTPG